MVGFNSIVRERSLRRATLSAALIIGLMLTAASPAAAIIGGQPDGDSHPYVAGIQQPDGDGVVFSGVLIGPRVVLTAGHAAIRLLVAGFTTARVTFDPVASDSSTWFTGSIRLNPGYDPGRIGTGDFAVIVFDHDIPGVQPAALPRAAQLASPESVAPDQAALTVIGYGLSRLRGGAGDRGPLGPDFTSGGTRKVDTERLLSLTPIWLWLAMNEGDQVCIGDSGAPSLLGGTNVVAGITIGSLGVCTSAVLDMRLDTPSARAFLGGYVPLP